MWRWHRIPFRQKIFLFLLHNSSAQQASLVKIGSPTGWGMPRISYFTAHSIRSLNRKRLIQAAGRMKTIFPRGWKAIEAVRIGSLFGAPAVLLKRRVPTRRGGGYYKNFLGRPKPYICLSCELFILIYVTSSYMHIHDTKLRYCRRNSQA